ncbi:MAG: L,D-transpeptidase family protein [Terriglobia bacterium]|nr:L,D-transpeptidase family protein [Terriglobia bacterium]
MPRPILTLLIGSVTLLTASLFAQVPPVLASANKLIVVTTPDWNNLQGTLTRYERHGKHWKRVGDKIEIVVGKNGLAWDPSLARGHSELYPGPVKHEGDGRSPAGIFPLNRGTFGFAPSLSESGNYRSLTPTTECVDDVKSQYYGQVVDRLKVQNVDWNSSEKMREIPQYVWGVIVNYNMDHAVPGNGSCIFLHKWTNSTTGTAGCTAMPIENIEAIVDWIGRKDHAVLVQLPESEYQRFQKQWQIP